MGEAETMASCSEDSSLPGRLRGQCSRGTSGHRGLPHECQLKSPFKSFSSCQERDHLAQA